ncbi:tetratricopeptide repeat protein [Microbacterium sp. ARD31]|uniref:tetratricopeptide repeat protein n=1 Tax=Microbacterium sp. ARD31 TaxID=2962576 RepID=UPI002880CE4B|nr:tetratricopeptide repeat protein [Microbacterium sp. ARD31]MDT0181903.1 tetratricopeptide repeat protein [Microbacterium sp. ARD31]
MSYILGYDPDTLREKVDPRRCQERLDEIGPQRSLPALLERVWLLKVLDRLDESLVLSEQSVRVARMAGTRKDLLRARILHASVMHWRGAYAAAEQELATCAAEAEGQGWSAIAAFAYQHRGKCFYSAGDYDLARADFKRALFLRQDAGASDAELQATLMAADAADRRRVDASVAS